MKASVGEPPPVSPPPTQPPSDPPPPKPPPTTPPSSNPPGREPTAPPTARTPPDVAPPTRPKPRTKSSDPLKGPGTGGLAGGGWADWWDTYRATLRDDPPPMVVTGEAPARDASALDALRRDMDLERGAPVELRAGALLGLARATAVPEDVGLLIDALRDARRRGGERAAASLALGLLRRDAPATPFEGRLLDRARGALFEALDDDRRADEYRAVAALALGLLGDQPTDPEDAFAREGRLVVRGLWRRLEQEPVATGDEVASAITAALGFQPPAGAPEAVRSGLRTLARTGHVGIKTHGPLARAHAMLALARLADGDSVTTLSHLLRSPSEDDGARRAAAVALGMMAPRIDPVRRRTATLAALDAAGNGNADTAGLSLVAVARMLAAEAEAGDATVLTTTDADGALGRAAASGAVELRPYATIARAIAVRAGGRVDAAPALKALRVGTAEDARDALAHGPDDDVRAAAALALGLLRDEAALPLLAQATTDERLAPKVRTRAAEALGLLGRPRGVVIDVLRRLRRVVGVPEETRREALRTLARLGDPQALEPALKEGFAEGDASLLSAAAAAVGPMRRAEVERRLLASMDDPALDAGARELAAIALGRVAEEGRPAWTERLGPETLHLAPTGALSAAADLP